MFGRSAKPEAAAPAPEEQGPGGGKGRPTPTRKEAEAARKAALKVPADPKEAKKAMRERERAARYEARQAIAAGDERALPTRDQGPVRAYVREFIDSRLTMGEVFVPAAVLVLVLGFVPNPTVILIVYYAWLAMMLGVVLDITRLLVRLNGELKVRWPEKSERKGALFYAAMRSLTLRRLRMPKPKVRRGGEPVVPKVKAAKG